MNSSMAIGARTQNASFQLVSRDPNFAKSSAPVGIKPFSIGGKSRAVSDSVAVKREWNESNWKVSTLDQVPLDFPLERTRREIHNVSSSEVAERISTTLRLLSVEAEFDDENAKAKCKTSDMVSFRIRLFAGGEDGLPVIVEIQRRSGSSNCFMRVCKKILDGAEGAVVKAESVPSRKVVPPFLAKGPVSGMKCLKDAALKRDPHAEASRGINTSLDLLRSKNKDVNVLGLENLCNISDPLKTLPDIALVACKAVIVGEHSLEIREEIGVMLQKDAFLPEEFEEDAMRELFDKCRHLALVLLSNVLVLTSKDGCLASAITSDKWFADFLIPSLLDEVKCFEASMNNAYEAACGLTCIASCSEFAQRVMEEHAAVEDLRAAHLHARKHHVLLANETERTLKALGHVVD
jgi:hypothetical protein